MMSPGSLQPIAEDLWIVDGPSVRFGPAKLPTRMVVVRLADGSVWINSPVAVAPNVQRAIEDIGCVRYLVAPTPLHLWRLEDARSRFAQAETWGPPFLRAKRSVAFDNVLGVDPPAVWSHDIDQVIFAGNIFVTEVEFLHKKSRTLIVADVLQNYRYPAGRVFANFLLRAAGVLDGGVPLDMRLSFTDRERARRSLKQLLAWDFDRLILAHGTCREDGAKAFVREAFRWLG